MPQSKKKKRILIAVVSGVVVVILAAIIGPIVYARTQSAAPPPLSVTGSPSAAPTSGADGSSSPSASKTTGSTATDDGTWKVSGGSEAGYRVDEVLNGQDVTVVGRTDKVSGTVEISADQLTAAEITVDVASVATDTARRDAYFRSTAMRTDEHPTATFTLTQPVDLPEIGGDAVKVKATGNLELVGKSRPVTATIEVVRSGGTVRASGSVNVTFADWGIEAPNLGFVKVEDKGQIEFLVALKRK